jgi:hypothetical protein
MEDFMMDLGAADESVVPASTQNNPQLYQPPHFLWPQLPGLHAPPLDDYLTFQFRARTGISAQVGDTYS